MFWKNKKEVAEVEWFKLTDVAQLDEIVAESRSKTVLIYKHSTRCGISSMAFDRLTRGWEAEYEDRIKPYYLDLIAYRELSNEVAKRFGVYHQSPQVILVKNGMAIYDNSHMAISFGILKEQL